MKACIVGLGGIGFKYDEHNPHLYETHFSALTYYYKNEELYFIDPNPHPELPRANTFASILNVPKKLILETTLFVISTPTDTHLQIIQDIVLKGPNSNAIFVIEKPMGRTLKEAIIINKLLYGHEVFVNYIRRSSALAEVLEQKNATKNLTEFKCFFDGDWHNIASHFIDFYLCLIKQQKKTDAYFENGQLKIIGQKSTASFEKAKFSDSLSPYKFEIISKHKWIGINGGDTLWRMTDDLDEKVIVCKNGMDQYQKRFYDFLFCEKKKSRLATMQDAINVHEMLEKIND